MSQPVPQPRRRILRRSDFSLADSRREALQKALGIPDRLLHRMNASLLANP